MGQLVAAPTDEPGEVAVELAVPAVAAGATVPFSVRGSQPGQELTLTLESAAARLRTAAVVELGSFTADADGLVEGAVRIPAATAPGAYTLSVVIDGESVASAQIAVTAAAGDPREGAPGAGGLPTTGAASMGPLAALALLLLLAGAAMRARRNGAGAA
ncbi:hypothetical protein GCM10009792_18870 [Microcella alkalica]|uniref:LPXTG cell wall anchor domain-containing protein n=1 Tax=Microcella alkalica TaxID=355930 RepID=A0A839EAC3_9MICO|nr:hypothetical protein [Microcella alkalica]